MQGPILAKDISQNAKTGPASVTYASQKSCPRDCPFLNNGCYAEHGKTGIITKRLNASTVKDPNEIARVEADHIKALADNGPRIDLRVHVVGDSRTPKAAQLVGGAMADYERRTGRSAWTYTHAWKRVKAGNWRGANVLASCESPRDVKRANAMGYVASLVVPEFKTHKTYEIDGVKLVPCPYQTRGVQCVKCRLCLDVERLRAAGLTVGFEPHGTRRKMVARIAEECSR